jgi:tetratricopeptide (TPR) repeat protein
MMGRLRLLVTVVCTLAPLAAVADDAQPWAVGVTDDQKARARVLLDQGNALFVDNKFPEALRAYGDAIEFWDHPAIRFNMVRALIQLDRHLEASRNLEKALAYGAAPLEDAVYKEAIAYRKLLADRIGTLEIECTQRDVAITVDGKDFVTCPTKQAIRVEPGNHFVVGTKAGLLTNTTKVTVFGGKTEHLKLTLDPLGANAKVVHRWPSYVPWVAFGAGAALIGAGGLLQLNASQQIETYNTKIDATCTLGCAPGEVDPAVDDIRKSAERKGVIAASLIVAGGAGIVTGAVLMYLNRGRTVYPEIAPLPGGGAAMTWGGRW